MATISLIAALGKNRVIGKTGNKLPWYLPADLKHFKSVTLGKPVIMGRKTHESISRPLPERQNIVITRDEEYKTPGCVVVHSPEEALRVAGDASEIMIIGGAEIFSQFMPRAKRMYLTLIDHEFEGNVYFPEWHREEWREVLREPHEPDEKNQYRYAFVTLEREGASNESGKS